MGTNNKPSENWQNHPHNEGQQNNTTPQVQGTGQRVSENKSHELSDMMNDNKSQKEEQVQQEERQP